MPTTADAASGQRPLADALVDVVLERMRARGLSVHRLARTIGVLQSTVHRRLHRRLHGGGEFGIDEWEAIAGALGTSLPELLAAATLRRGVPRQGAGATRAAG